MPNSTYQVTDRRPLGARSWGISRKLATGLCRLGISPNAISVVGVLASLIAGGLLAMTPRFPEAERFLWLATALLILVRGMANMLDGMVAVESGRASPVGELFNEVPDRLSDSAMLIGLGFAVGGDPLLGSLAALAAVFTAYTRAIGKVAGAPQDYRGPMAKMQRMATVATVAVVGTLSPETLLTRIAEIALPSLALLLIIVGCVVTSIRRLLGAATYLKNRTP